MGRVNGAESNGLFLRVMANRQHFLKRRHSRNCFDDTVFQQCLHAGEAGLAT
jgi:hypothetical protein